MSIAVIRSPSLSPHNNSNIVVSLNGSTLTITVKSGTAGDAYIVTLTANDGKGGIASSTFDVFVTA